MSPFWHQEFSGGSYIFWKIWAPLIIIVTHMWLETICQCGYQDIHPYNDCQICLLCLIITIKGSVLNMYHSISAHIGEVLKVCSDTRKKVSIMLIYMLVKPVYQNIMQPNYELRNWSSYCKNTSRVLFILFFEITLKFTMSTAVYNNSHPRTKDPLHIPS